MRGVARWVAVLSVVASVALVCAFTLRHSLAPGRLLHSSHASVDTAASTNAKPNVPDLNDSFGDGTPDFLRLADSSDRQAFRGWFTLLAEAQFLSGRKLPREIQDCASLLRYSYREALRRHDSAWANSVALPISRAPGDVRQYQYPYTPSRASIFRVREGAFAPGDLHNGAFAEFADAKTLWRDNTYIVGRDLRQARPGDLLFFRQSGHDLPFHAMIFLGHSRIEAATEEYVVYHTGPSGKSPGEIRRLSVAELMDYPDARWRPVVSNPAFLGVYRWNILREGE
jgi:uncharacterized protein YfaT (DUF1175 family)